MNIEDKIKSTQPTPEQLLKLLEAEMGASREQRAKGESRCRNRNVLVVFIVLMVVFATVALWVLTFILDEKRPAGQRSRQQGVLKESR